MGQTFATSPFILGSKNIRLRYPRGKPTGHYAHGIRVLFLAEDLAPPNYMFVHSSTPQADVAFWTN